jgi:hypothetical protein
MAAVPADAPPGLAFWIHQAVEYLLGVLVISQAVQTDSPTIPVLVGGAIILLAATADGPLAAFHAVPRSVHRVLDVVAVGALVVVAVLWRDELGSAGLIFTLVAAVAMAGLVVRTNYRPPRTVRRPRPATSTTQPATRATTEADEAAVPAEPRSKGEVYSRAAGRALGKGIRAYRGSKPPSPAPPPPPPAGSPPPP